MGILVYDEIMLREPRLLVPGRRPVGHVRLSRSLAIPPWYFAAVLGNSSSMRSVPGTWAARLGEPYVTLNASSNPSKHIIEPDGVRQLYNSGSYANFVYWGGSESGDLTYSVYILSFTAFAANTVSNSFLRLGEGTRNQVEFDPLGNVINIVAGNTPVAVSIPNFLSLGPYYNVVAEMDQTNGSTRECAVYINGRKFTTSSVIDLSHVSNIGVQILTNQLVPANDGFGLLVQFAANYQIRYGGRKLSPGLLHKLSLNPYLLVEPA